MLGSNTTRSNGTTGKTRKRYSDVDTKTTPMSEADIDQVVNSRRPYFQSSNSFTINQKLRDMKDGDTVEDVFTGWHVDNLDTVRAMDRNMLPLNKDINVARMAAFEYLDIIMKSAGFSMNDVYNAIDGDREVIARMNAKLAGVIVYEKSYMSTSYRTNSFNGAFTDRPLKMNVTATAGTHAMFNPNPRKEDNESEMVFARGTGQRLIEFYYSNNQLQVRTQTVPQTKVKKS